MIQDYELLTFENGNQWDESKDRATKDRFGLRFRQEYSTPQGPRIAWVFQVNGFQISLGGVFPVLCLITTDDYHIISFQTFQAINNDKFTPSNPSPGTFAVTLSGTHIVRTDTFIFTATEVNSQTTGLPL